MMNEAIGGDAAYPALNVLTTAGAVMEDQLPENPYNKLNTVKASPSQAAANNRTVDGTTGWMYYVDNSTTPPTFIFWANTDDETTATDSDGDPVDANDL